MIAELKKLGTRSKLKLFTDKVEDESRLKCCITPLNHERETSTSCVSYSSKLSFILKSERMEGMTWKQKV